MATNKRAGARGAPAKGWLVAAGIGIPIVALAAVYLMFFTPDSPKRLSLSANESGSVSASPLDGRWSVAAGSEAGYRVREKLAQLPASSDAVGRTTAITGGFDVSADGGSLVVRDTSFEADLTQLKSDQDKRDNRIRTMGLESDRFPTATFKASDAIQVPANVGTGEVYRTTVTGDLTIHGVTKRVTIPVEVQRRGENVELAGSMTFPFSEFGMQPPNVPPLVSVENDATMEFKLLLSRVAA